MAVVSPALCWMHTVIRTCSLFHVSGWLLRCVLGAWTWCSALTVTTSSSSSTVVPHEQLSLLPHGHRPLAGLRIVVHLLCTSAESREKDSRKQVTDDVLATPGLYLSMWAAAGAVFSHKKKKKF